jgi:hypothetical protein
MAVTTQTHTSHRDRRNSVAAAPVGVSRAGHAPWACNRTRAMEVRRGLALFCRRFRVLFVQLQWVASCVVGRNRVCVSVRACCCGTTVPCLRPWHTQFDRRCLTASVDAVRARWLRTVTTGGTCVRRPHCVEGPLRRPGVFAGHRRRWRPDGVWRGHRCGYRSVACRGNSWRVVRACVCACVRSTRGLCGCPRRRHWWLRRADRVTLTASQTDFLRPLMEVSGGMSE